MKREDFINEKKSRREAEEEPPFSLSSLRSLIAHEMSAMEKDRMPPRHIYISHKDRMHFQAIGDRGMPQSFSDTDTGKYNSYYTVFGMTIVPTTALEPGQCMLVSKPWQVRGLNFSKNILTEPVPPPIRYMKY